MDASLLKSALIRFAESELPEAKDFLQTEAAKIKATLSTTTAYDTIQHNLELLDSFAYRVPDEAFAVITATLNCLETITLKIPDDPYWSAESRQAFYSSDKLMIACLNVLNRIRYFKLAEILPIFLQYQDHTAEPVRKQVQDHLETMASYDLALYEHYGLQPQQNILEVIQKLTPDEQHRFLPSLVTLCKAILSPNIEGASSTYQTITLHSGVHPVTPKLKAVRQDAIEILKKLYARATTLDEKKSVLGGLNAASQHPKMGGSAPELLELLQDNGKDVLGFLEQIVPTERELSFIQEIEHSTYWKYYHGHRDTKAAACRVKAQLDKNEEYQAFKVLIGFHGIFHPWCGDDDAKNTIDNKVELAKQRRDARLEELLNDVHPETYPVWQRRILEWVKIESNDLATFPYFEKFLKKTAEKNPTFVLELLREHDAALQKFIIPLLLGLLQSAEKQAALAVRDTWLNEKKYLWELTKVCEHTPDFDSAFFKKLVHTAMERKDIPVLSTAVGVIAAKVDAGGDALVNTLFPEMIRKLTECASADWVYGFWFRAERQKISAIMTEDTINAVLENCIYLPRIDYHAEYTLQDIAARFPIKIVDLFRARLESGKTGNYEAIPYNLSEIPTVLEDAASDVTRTIRKWYDSEHGTFKRASGRVLKILYPSFPDTFKTALLNLIEDGDEQDYLFVMAVLKNYDGDIKIQDVCAALINALPTNSHYLKDMEIILSNTGGVFGEYGLVDAYNAKIAEIEPWLNNKSLKIQSFTQSYVRNLEKMIESEKKRTNEDIEIRKYRFGD
ncbi:MAG: hypothetical protein ACK5O1_07335 [Holosporales bacterium]|jgi:hypothetical protein